MSLLICQPKNGNELATQEIHADPEFYIFCNASSFFEVNKCDDNWAKCRSSFAYRKNMATTRQRRRNHSVSEFDISFDARRTSVEPAKTGMKPSAAPVICFRLNSRRGSLFFRAVDRNTKSSERQKEKRQKEKQTRQTIREPWRLRWVPTRRRRTRIKMEMSHQQLARPLHRTESKKKRK